MILEAHKHYLVALLQYFYIFVSKISNLDLCVLSTLLLRAAWPFNIVANQKLPQLASERSGMTKTG